MSTLESGVPATNERYFCHECRAFIEPISPEALICPTCNGSFIEEVTGENETEFEAEDDSQLNQHALDYQNDVFSLIHAFLPGIAVPGLSGSGMPMTMGSDSNSDSQAQSGNLFGALEAGASGSNPSENNEAGNATANETAAASTDTRSQRPRRQMRNPRMAGTPHSIVFDSSDGEDVSMLSNPIPVDMPFSSNDALHRLIDGLMLQSPFNAITVNGNPQDYAWGPGGLDAILTQMMDQLEGGGPPPCSQSVIDSISTVVVNEEHIKSESDCSVCQDKFSVGEKVKCLPCRHMFHKDCIEPWLKLHNACPVCRKALDDPNSASQPSTSGGPSSNGTSRVPNYEDLDEPDPSIFRNSNAYG